MNLVPKDEKFDPRTFGQAAPIEDRSKGFVEYLEDVGHQERESAGTRRFDVDNSTCNL